MEYNKINLGNFDILEVGCFICIFSSLTNIIDLKCCEFEKFFISLQSYMLTLNTR